jgi:transcriptional regulator with XRE-family HTH domain
LKSIGSGFATQAGHDFPATYRQVRRKREETMNRGVRTDGEQIVKLRRESGRTQEQLAGECDLAVNTIRSAERGGPVDVTVVSDIAQTLNVEVRDLLAAPDCGSALRDNQDVLDKIAGRWIGRIDQPRGPDGKHFSAMIRMEIERAGVNVRGRSFFTFGAVTHICTVEVRWLFERYFRLDGVSADPQGCMFNTCYFQINPAGDRITGRYIGFGPHSNCIIVGEVSGSRDEA